MILKQGHEYRAMPHDGKVIRRIYRGGRCYYIGSPYSPEATQALKAAFPQYFAAICDYGWANPQLVPFINEDPMNAVGIGQFFTNAELQAVADAQLISTKQLDDGSCWVQLLHHHIKNGTQIYPNIKAAFYNVNSELFSITKYIANFMRDNKFEFLVDEYYSDGGALSIQRRWSQTSNPYTDTALTGFVNISNGIGIYKHNGEQCPIITKATWWGATGAVQAYQGGIPAYDGYTINKGTLDLWIRLS